MPQPECAASGSAGRSSAAGVPVVIRVSTPRMTSAASTPTTPYAIEAVRQPTTVAAKATAAGTRSEEHTSELQSLAYLVCRLLLEKKKKNLCIAFVQRHRATASL